VFTLITSLQCGVKTPKVKASPTIMHIFSLRTFMRKFSSGFFFKFLLQSDNCSQLVVSEMSKKIGVTNFVLEVKRVEKYPDFEKLAQVIQHALEGFIVKNIEGESM